jgi:CheY-like chemotaxis protein
MAIALHKSHVHTPLPGQRGTAGIDHDAELAAQAIAEQFDVVDARPQPRTLLNHVLGRPLETAAIPHQTIGKAIGLAVFASDALSSVAYATEEILLVLAAAGALFFAYALPIAGAIAALLLVLTLSYRQTIFAYPGGGGAYIVARDNLGEEPAQTAGAALLTDYVLTVAVSISSDVAQITSAFPRLQLYTVPLCVTMTAVMTLVNLRGVKESGRAFAGPTYFFISMTFLLLGVGKCQALRARTVLPILVLAAGADAHERISLLRAGADDALARPFAPQELVARLHAKLRRAVSEQPTPASAAVGLERRSMVGDQRVCFSPSELRLLTALQQRNGGYITVGELAHALADRAATGTAVLSHLAPAPPPRSARRSPTDRDPTWARLSPGRQPAPDSITTARR